MIHKKLLTMVAPGRWYGVERRLTFFCIPIHTFWSFIMGEYYFFNFKKKTSGKKMPKIIKLL